LKGSMATKSGRATESQRPCQGAQPEAIVVVVASPSSAKNKRFDERVANYENH
jgi:hypothetical protein